MLNRAIVDSALAQLAANPEQHVAALETTHSVVLAGPGSGKTKTLTTAMARALLEDVSEPRGIACITYNNECAIELEGRLAKLGIEPTERVFIGTVHSFALAHIISPYARCVDVGLPGEFRVATESERRRAIQESHAEAIDLDEDVMRRWRFAEEKRRAQVDRREAIWSTRNPDLKEWIETYEAKLRSRGLIDFDDMPLLAVRMLLENPWICTALNARFPILFVDEYQDLGHALDLLVQLLCFGAGSRLFAVGDADQSIYGFMGANPRLLIRLTERDDVHTHRLRFNYRCGTEIIKASQAALGEERDYRAANENAKGEIFFHPVDGDLSDQANFIAQTIVPGAINAGVALEEIAILYRTAQEGTAVAEALAAAGYPLVRADNQALVRRNSRLARFLEACARWVVGGWRDNDPPFRRLAMDAATLVYGVHRSSQEVQTIQTELIKFLSSSIERDLTTHAWLAEFRQDIASHWRKRARASVEDWDVLDTMIERTEPVTGNDLSLAFFGGRIEGSGRINLSTLHSSKGREFDVVAIIGVDRNSYPHARDQGDAIRARRREFYVGVTRARKALHLVFPKGFHSAWVKELYDRVHSSH